MQASRNENRPPAYHARPDGQQNQHHERAQHQPAPHPGPSLPEGTSFLAGLSTYNETKRYTVHSLIGKGSYGLVCAAKDNLTGEMVAIKKIQNVFDNVADAHRILREITLLRVLRHPDIVEIKHIMLPSDPNTFKDLYVCFELMESDLHTVIGANDDLTADHHKVFLFQLLRGLNFMHSNGVLHRDLKPKNILANSNCKLKICDFGLARPHLLDGAGAAPLTPVLWTDYVATRWYRAPELCGCFYGRYSSAVDMWSIGCIFAEVLLGKPLFPGRDAVNQLQLITDLLGKPPPHVIDAIGNVKARAFLNALEPKRPRQLSSKFPAADPLALDLLARLLAFDPAVRPTAAEALGHPYFSGLPSAVQQESVCIADDFQFESCRLSEGDVRHLIYREALQYHPHVLRAYSSQVAALQQQQAAAAAQVQAAQAAQAAAAAQAAQAQALAAQAAQAVQAAAAAQASAAANLRAAAAAASGLSPRYQQQQQSHFQPSYHLGSASVASATALGAAALGQLMDSGRVPSDGCAAANPHTLASTSSSDAVSLAFMLHAQDSSSGGGGLSSSMSGLSGGGGSGSGSLMSGCGGGSSSHKMTSLSGGGSSAGFLLQPHAVPPQQQPLQSLNSNTLHNAHQQQQQQHLQQQAGSNGGFQCLPAGHHTHGVQGHYGGNLAPAQQQQPIGPPPGFGYGWEPQQQQQATQPMQVQQQHAASSAPYSLQSHHTLQYPQYMAAGAPQPPQHQPGVMSGGLSPSAAAAAAAAWAGLSGLAPPAPQPAPHSQAASGALTPRYGAGSGW
ncbi:hypothetical protein HXX76_013860 [Chlamydomonas incerta]|uniref:Protein kinase domain-containing protein n=1 Tax=Chlamydomonas incerta TaxID=51695 RepID=A0A835VTH6_CHLIN|nr:hypothetical protein HXX76_013860 [Chlamydomonas incerta]|eukprot:KAG2425278.1 hypothetical protein HXX76_013860 [Chlamydomonas incerta]